MVNFLSDFVPIIFVGISLGSLFGLVGLAYTCIVNSTQLVNFGQGDFCMVGVFAAWFVMSVLGLPLWLGFIVAIAAGILMGIITERILVTPLMQKDAAPFFPIIGMMAIGQIAAGAVGIYTRFYWMPINHFMGLEPWRIGSVPISTQGVFIMGATIILVVGYWFLLNKTLQGTALRAIGFDRDVSALLGIQVSRMVSFSFILSGAISAIAGVLCAPLSAFTAHEGLPLAVNGFIALIVGGWGNPYAAVLGGITIGLIRSLLTGYFSSAYAELATFSVLILVLTIRPQGLFPGFMVPRANKE